MNIYSPDLELVRRLGHKCSTLPGPKLKFMPVFTFNNKTMIIKRIFVYVILYLKSFWGRASQNGLIYQAYFFPSSPVSPAVLGNQNMCLFLFKTPSPCETWALASTWALVGGGDGRSSTSVWSLYPNSIHQIYLSKRNPAIAVKIIQFSPVHYTCLFPSLDYRLHERRDYIHPIQICIPSRMSGIWKWLERICCRE